MSLILRTSNTPNVGTDYIKGTPLTYPELDGNFAAISQSFLQRPLIYPGPGIIINTAGNASYISSSVISVNGQLPVNGNIAVSFTSVITGQLSSRPAVAPDATVFVVSTDPTIANNGDAYIYVAATGNWEPIAPLDIAVANQQYLRLDGTNSPMQGDIDMGGFDITNAGFFYGTAQSALVAVSATTAITANTASFITASRVFGPYGANSVLSASYGVSSSQAVTASYALNAGGGVPGGADTQMQFNSGSSFSGSSKLTFNYNTNELSLQGSLIATSITSSNYVTFGDFQTLEGTNAGRYTFRQNTGTGKYFEWIQNGGTPMTLTKQDNLLLGTTDTSSFYRMDIRSATPNSGSLKVDNTLLVSGSSIILSGSTFATGAFNLSGSTRLNIPGAGTNLVLLSTSSLGDAQWGALSYLATGSVTASVVPGTTDTFTVVRGTDRLLTVNGGTFSGSVTLSRLYFAYPTGSRQIRIGTEGTEGGTATASDIIAIGGYAAQNLSATGSLGQGESLIAIGTSAGASLTTGGRHSIMIGRGAGNGITTGTGNTIISSGDHSYPNLTGAIIITGYGISGNGMTAALNTPVIGTSKFAFIGGGFDPNAAIQDYYFGAGPFVLSGSQGFTGPEQSHINFYSPSATGSSNMSGSNFTINAGRGTGAGTPGDFYVRTANTGSSGVTLQTLVNRLVVKGNSGNVGIGTISPSQSLTVAGNALVSSSATNILTVVGSGSANPLFRVLGSQGELFTVTDTMSGSLFSVNDISGLPIVDVRSDQTTLIGNYLAPALYSTIKATINTGVGQVIYSVPTASYDSAYYDYNIRSGSTARAGQIMAIWSGSAVNFTEVSASSFGTTTGFTFGVIITGSNLALTGSATTSGWTVKTIIKAI